MPSLREAVARLFFAGLPGPTLDRETRRLHRTTPFGGAVLFRRNAAPPARLRNLTAALHALDPQLPPLVAIDHEGGRVHRLNPPFTHFPPAAEVAAHGVAAVRAVARAMARELAAIDVDLTFAPVLDVASNPSNPVIGDRALGTAADAVARLGVAYHRAARAEGLVTCGKHFPGHGDTATDSHLELPIVERNRRGLAAIEIPPFARAIAAGVPMLMTAHVLYPALDRELPATLSKRVLTGLLRRRLGFRGVLCSDDFGMRAITDHWGAEEAAVLSLAAGADALLFCQDQAKLATSVDAVERAVARGTLAEARIAEAYRRVTGLTRWRLRHRRRPALGTIGAAAHARLNARVRSSAND
jgi:beta-N-acetylhexosaminidase